MNLKTLILKKYTEGKLTPRKYMVLLEKSGHMDENRIPNCDLKGAPVYLYDNRDDKHIKKVKEALNVVKSNWSKIMNYIDNKHTKSKKYGVITSSILNKYKIDGIDTDFNQNGKGVFFNCHHESHSTNEPFYHIAIEVTNNKITDIMFDWTDSQKDL